eukprot:682886-Pleurochrysis_carterae.AAC.1
MSTSRQQAYSCAATLYSLANAVPTTLEASARINHLKRCGCAQTSGTGPTRRSACSSSLHASSCHARFLTGAFFHHPLPLPCPPRPPSPFPSRSHTQTLYSLRPIPLLSHTHTPLCSLFLTSSLSHTQPHIHALPLSHASAAVEQGGTTTGISAADRAATFRALADPNSKPSDFNRP